MKIRIIKNNPPKNCSNASDISEYIGQVLEAYVDENGDVVISEKCGIIGGIIFTGEYEIIDGVMENIESTSRKMINEYKSNPKMAIEQLEFCGYECEGGVLINNVAFIALKELIMEGDEI